MKILRCFFFLFLSIIDVSAQEIELKELTAPSSPAFAILGLNPTMITRPTLAKAFALNLANGLDGTSISPDIAIESTPFWWKPQHSLTYREYYKSDTVWKNMVNTIKQTTALSIATSDASPQIDSIDSRFISMGIRFMAIRGKPSALFDSTYHALIYDLAFKSQTIAHIKRLVNQGKIVSFEQLRGEVSKNVKDYIESSDALKALPANKKKLHENETIAYITDFLLKIDTSSFKKEAVADFLENERSKFIDLINQALVEMQGMSRVGWMLEFALASSLLAPTNNIELTYGHEWAGWATLTHRFENKKNSKVVNDFNLMARRGGNFLQSNSSNTDFGLSWVTSGINHSLTLEGIFRCIRTSKQIKAIDGNIYKVPETNSTWRFALAYQYKFSEAINVSITAGKDFDNSYITSGGFFSLLNINLTLPSTQTIKVTK